MTDASVNVTLVLPRPSSGRSAHIPTILASPKPTEIPENHVLLRVDRFGFSANNITYQALGEHPHFRYFDFHPLPKSGHVSSKTDGLIPVWGFASVVESSHPKVAVGERVYGYLAPARYLLIPVSPTDVNKYNFYVPRPHLPEDRRPYNQITRCAADPQYTPGEAAEDFAMLYRPLFWTSFWCEDWMWSSNYRGGSSTILISSASSKTAFCLAYLIRARGSGVRIVGLTSSRNVKFTKGLGLYDEVLEYSTFALSPAFDTSHGAKKRWIYVDVAGNSDLNRTVYDRFVSPYSSTLAAVISLGMTNLSPSATSACLPWTEVSFTADSTSTSASTSDSTSAFWPHEEQFFMQEWLFVRKNQLTSAQIFEMQLTAWTGFVRNGKDFVKIERVHGPQAVERTYKSLMADGVSAEKGLIWSLWESDAPQSARL